jgi:integrase
MPKVTQLRPTKQAVPSAVLRNVERRRYLTPDEVDRLVATAGRLGRHGHRDATMILLAYRHGLRVSELVSLRWDQVNLKAGVLHVSRLKGSESGPHPLHGPELRALRRVQRDYGPSTYVFVSERGGPLTRSSVQKMLERVGEVASVGVRVHPHMLRHSCGYKLANDNVATRTIAAYLGHRNLNNAALYTRLAPGAFTKLWRD